MKYRKKRKLMTSAEVIAEPNARCSDCPSTSRTKSVMPKVRQKLKPETNKNRHELLSRSEAVRFEVDKRVG